MKQNQQLKLTIDLNKNPDLEYPLEKFYENESLISVIDLAYRLKERGYLEESKAIYKDLFEAELYIHTVILGYADLSLATGCDEKAQELYEIHKNNQNIDENPHVMHNLGLIYWRQGKKEKAINLWEQVIKKYPEFNASFDALIHVVRGNNNQQRVKSLIKWREINLKKHIENVLPEVKPAQRNKKSSWLARLFNRIFGL